MRRNSHRFGFVSIEILVSATLLVALISSLAAMQYRLLLVAKDTKHYQLALHEAANQIIELQAAPLPKLDEAIELATINEEVLQALPGGKMQIEKIADTKGTRVIVRLTWERLGASVPVELTGWISTAPSEDLELKGEVGA